MSRCAVVLLFVFAAVVFAEPTADEAEWSQALAAASARMIQSGRWLEIFSTNPGDGNFLPFGYPGLEQGAPVDSYQFPNPPRPGGRLAAVLQRKAVSLQDSAGAAPPWIDTTGASPTGIAFQLLSATYEQLGAHYGVDLKLNDTIYKGIAGNITGSNQALEALFQNGDSSGAYWSTAGAYGSAKGSFRRSIAFQKVTVNAGLSSYFSVLSNSNITNLNTLQATIFISDAPIIGTIGAGPRQTLVALFPQAQVVDYVSASTAISRLLDKTALALALMTIPANYSTQISSYSLELVNEIGSFTNQPYPLDVANPTGREALASAFDASLVGVASQGIRKIAIGTAPAVTIADCNPTPSSFPFPTPVGTLQQRLAARSIRVGELKSFVSGDYSPWYLTNSTGVIPRMMNAIANNMISNYNLAGTLEFRRLYFDTVDQMLLALRSGDIDVTSPFLSPGSVLNGTVDFIEFRQTCSLLGVPYVFYVLPSMGVINITGLKSVISLNAAFKVAVPNDGASQLLSALLGENIQRVVVGTLKTALSQVGNGAADAAFGWRSDLTEAQPLVSMPSGAVKIASAFFRRDGPTYPPKKGKSHTLRNAMIGLGCVVFVILLAIAIVIIMRKQFHVILVPKSASTNEAW